MSKFEIGEKVKVDCKYRSEGIIEAVYPDNYLVSLSETLKIFLPEERIHKAGN